MMPAPDPLPAWHAQRIQSSFMQAGTAAELPPEALTLGGQLPPTSPLPLHPPLQPLPQPVVQTSLSGLPPGDPITPHGRSPGGSSSSSDAGDVDGDSGIHARGSSQARSSLSSSPHPHAARHRPQPSWPRLSTSGAPVHAGRNSSRSALLLSAVSA